ncbi:hypothetical protein MVEN_00297300 [Mycena venus]|uniref:GED domain-containing protein n=1 Tax=Mycena venus TaxID=2733690 RepID=A0A8H6Z2J6_9AGAR|nr:hypothetical protein MVEN_00297300 [Mycena venus]
MISLVGPTFELILRRTCITDLAAKYSESCGKFLIAMLEVEQTPFTQNHQYLQASTEKWLSHYKDERAEEECNVEQGSKRRKLGGAQTSVSTPRGAEVFKFDTLASPSSSVFNLRTTFRAAPPDLTHSVSSGSSACKPQAEASSSSARPPSPSTPTMANSETINNVLAQLAELGYSNITPEDFGKLRQVDEFETEITVMSEIQGYFECAYKRVIDNIPALIDSKFLRAIAQNLQQELISEFGLGSENANAVCTALLVEDPRLVAKREELMAMNRQPEAVQIQLHNFGLDTTAASEDTGVGLFKLNKSDPPQNVKTGTFIIYSPLDDGPETTANAFTTNDLAFVQGSLGIGGCLMSIYEPVDAASWIEDNWDNALLIAIRTSGCGGPFACMLSPEEPALAIFGSYNEPVVVNMAQTLADSSGFPVVIRTTSDNPALTLLAGDIDPNIGYVQFNNTSDTNDQMGRGLGDDDQPVPEDEHTPNETGNGRRRDNNPADAQVDEMISNAAKEPDSNRDGGSGQQSDGGDGGGGGGDPARMAGKWESPLHRTRVKLCLKLSTGQRYAVAIGYTFKFTINPDVKIPIDMQDLSRPLSQPEVIAVVDFEVETRPRETRVDRSYANIGFVAHRRQSIVQRKFFHRGFDLPDQLYKRGQQQQVQRGIQGSFGFSQGSALATTTFSYSRNNGTTLEATDSKVMPKCRVDYEPGDEWDENERSYSSYNIAYQLQDMRFDSHSSEFHPLEFRMGMGINLRPPAGFKKTASATVVHKTQSGVDMGFGPNIEGRNTWNHGYNESKNEKHNTETLSLSIAQVQTHGAPKKSRTGVSSLIAKLGKRSSTNPDTLIPPHEYLARGWDAHNDQWRSVLWPALDKHFRAAGLTACLEDPVEEASARDRNDDRAIDEGALELRQ